MYFVYILECQDGSLYTGISTDVERRFKEHAEGKGGHYTKAHKPIRIVYVEAQESRSAALKREVLIKKLSRKGKEELLATYKKTT